MLIFLFCLIALASAVPIQLGFHWHLHQPIYYPYESVVDTINNNRFGFSVLDVFDSRAGPYNSWPVDAVSAANQAGLGHCGAQVSFTGALQENLNNLQHSSLTNNFNNWQSRWIQSQSMKTKLGNQAMALTGFGYHHPLMPLTDPYVVEVQILLHRLALQKVFQLSGPFSTGLFPPENEFSEKMIPALVKAGIKWVLVDNEHFFRTHADYKWSPSTNLFPPNPSDMRNKNPTNWVQLNNIWCPEKVPAPYGYTPYWVQYTDPETGEVSKVIAIPGARYEGVEDGRGGFGAFLYQQVMQQYLFANTNASRPMLVILAHDGDNYGGGTDSYYHGNFNNFVQWISSSSDFVCTTIDDYLQSFPVPDDEVIHVEDGGWSGANNGGPDFSKWDPNFFQETYEPERNSWATLVAATNRLLTMNNITAWQSLDNILSGNGSPSEVAWHYFLCGGASDYWYWPTLQVWNSDPTRAFNLAMKYADPIINSGSDNIGPTIFPPQRQYWNPGAVNWNPNKPDPSDFGIWTTAYDVSGISSVQLMLRVTPNQKVPSPANELYKGGNWISIEMQATPFTGPLAPQTDPLPLYIGALYKANVTGIKASLIDYYVIALDNKGNGNKTPISHVYVDTH